MMEDRISEVRSWVEEHDSTLYRSAEFNVEEIRDSGNGIPGSYAIKGTAAVFRKWSLNLGGFRERIMPGAFDRVLSEDPHVIHTWDHDTSKSLSSTRSKKFPLELKALEDALGFYSRVAPTTYAADLRILVDGDVVNQSSFAFIPKESEWRYIEDEDMLERDVHEIDGLFDVTTCAMGAYPQTESEIAVRSLLKGAKRSNGVFFPATFAASTTTTSANGTAAVASRTTDLVRPDFAAFLRQLEERAGEWDYDDDWSVYCITSMITLASSFMVAADDDVALAAMREIMSSLASMLDVEITDADAATERKIDRADERVEPSNAAPPVGDAKTPEALEALEREFKLWQQKRAAEHRRTREFAFGVTQDEEKTK